MSAPLEQVTRLAWLTPTRRQYVYVVLCALVPVLVFYGIVDSQTAALWTAVGAAVLGLGTAAGHVNRGDQ